MTGDLESRWGHLVARTLPNSRHLVVPDAAHGHFGLRNVECVRALTVQFIRSGAIAGIGLVVGNGPPVLRA